jgi:hypothetical protein
MTEAPPTLLDSLLSLENEATALCTLGQSLTTLDADTRAALDRVLNNNLVSTNSISSTLKGTPQAAHRETINAHREQNCRCFQ